jgi:hypothetical protein
MKEASKTSFVHLALRKKSFSAIVLTHATFPLSGPQGNLKQLFFVLTQSQKSMPAYAAQTLAKIKW